MASAPPWTGVLLVSFVTIGLFFYAIARYLRRVFRKQLDAANAQRRSAILKELALSETKTENLVLVGFFHPYCNAGGGGERVLWAAIACMQREEPNVVCVLYTGDVGVSKLAMAEKAQNRFSISIDPSRLHLIHLNKRRLIEDATWPRFTMIGQSIGSIALGWEALQGIVPDIFIDTMGYAFTFPLVKFCADIPVGAYVHYPTISTNMLQRVRQRSQGHTNTSTVASSTILSFGKLYYYLIFARLYAFCLRQANYLMVNSSWTKAHIDGLLSGRYTDLPDYNDSTVTPSTGSSMSARIVYPPCDSKTLSTLKLENRENVLLSVAQFRPEKEHETQIRAFQAYLDLRPELRGHVKLIMAGSVRNQGDEDRVQRLRDLVQRFGLESNIEFVINAPWQDLVRLFARASIGLSTMIDEHFGINVVEFMAAGLITVAHASGGPLLDIVVPYQGLPTGFHASSINAFARRIDEVFSMPESEKLAMRERARALALEKFNEATFDTQWMEAWRELASQHAGVKR